MASCSICDDSPDPRLDCSRCGYKGRVTPHTDDECSCARCQHPSLESSFGFRDAAKAEDITRHLARGTNNPYWLVRSHMGIWYFIKVPVDNYPREPSVEVGHGRKVSAFHLQILSYLGCEIVKTFDALGDEVPR